MTTEVTVFWILGAWLLGAMFGWAMGAYAESRKAYMKFLEVLAEVEANNGSK